MVLQERRGLLALVVFTVVLCVLYVCVVLAVTF